MATGTEGGKAIPQPIPQASHRGAPAPSAGSAVSPPSRRELASWWKKFRKTTEKDEEKVTSAPGIFGVPLVESIRYANVAISLTDEQGESFIYGYVPIVVAKCGVFLKEKATDVEGIFRLSGSAKRIKDLQTVFNSPERYGKGLDWTGYTVHDAANILRRYLNQLPEPIVPLDEYERFRDPLRAYQQRLQKHPEGHTPEITATEHTTAVAAYQRLITKLPALNRQLLLYILDLLAVFASKSDLNRMNAANLAAIFQPGIISHPVHDMAPQEYRLSQDVLIFLIENQDNFLIGMTGTGLDEKTQRDVESGAPSLKSPKSNIGRSASNASAGADSLRKYGLRRNVSTSSHASRERTSPNVSNPGTPVSPSFSPGGSAIGVARSNTVPSKRSPAIAQHRFQRVADPSSPSSPMFANAVTEAQIPAETPKSKSAIAQGPSATTPNRDLSANNVRSSIDERTREPSVVPFPDMSNAAQSVETPQAPPNSQSATLQVPKPSPAGANQTRERKISSLFSKSPMFGPSDPPQSQSQRQPRKLQKRQRLPGATIDSAQSSAASLQADEPYHTPLVSPELSHSQVDPMSAAGQVTAATSTAVNHEQSPHQNLQTPPHVRDFQDQRRGSGPPKSPAASLRSGTSVTDPSDLDALDDPVTRAEKKRNRWRFSSSARKTDDSPLAPPPPIGQLPGARTSNSSVGSSGRPRQSFTAETQLAHQITDSSSMGQPSVMGQSSYESNEQVREAVVEEQKKSIFGKWKAKMTQSREERREREAEKERAKSPQRMVGDNASSRHSLSAFAHDHLAARGRSFDKSREDVLQPVNEQPRVEARNIGIATSTMGEQNAVPMSSASPAKVPISNQTHDMAPQTASITAPTSVPLSVPTSSINAAPTSASVSEAPHNASGPVVMGNPGPTVASEVTPSATQEPYLGVDTRAAEMAQPDSVQHTPTEVKGLEQ